MLVQQPIDRLLIASSHGPRRLALRPNAAPIEQWESKLTSVIRHPFGSSDCQSPAFRLRRFDSRSAVIAANNKSCRTIPAVRRRW
jgi:hypothetical protein